MKRIHRCCNAVLFTGMCTIFAVSSFANISVSNLFSSAMVLQRDMPVPIWGKAAANEAVTVTFNGQKKEAVAGTTGDWKIVLDSMRAGGPFTMTITGKSTITITDVVVGEVWNCAGQSNMDTRVSYYPHYRDIQNSFNNPRLRYYTLRQPGGRVTKWEKCTSPALVGDLSCLGFFFGRELQQKLDTVTVGLVVTAVGGTTIASWLDPATLKTHPDIAGNDASAGTMYTSWVAPVAGCALRGTVLIQGEQDRSASLAPYYKDRFPLLINGWRKVWGIGDFPFYWVQLANYGTKQSSTSDGAGSTADIREVQRLGLSIPATGMAVAIDIGDSLHFGNKLEAGHRLALIARAKQYGESGLVFSGPLFNGMTIVDSKIHCTFIHCGTGLTTKDSKKPSGFAICGSDNKWVWADATIGSDTVTLSSAQVAKPLQVRYAYAGNPIGNLCNKEGLPASPFTTEGPQLPVSVAANAARSGYAATARPLTIKTSLTAFSVDATGRAVSGERRNVSGITFTKSIRCGIVNMPR